MDRPLKELLKGGVLLKELKSVEDVWNFKINNQERIFHSATHEEIIKGGTADLYFVRTRELLAAAGKENTVVVAEIFCSREGVLAGVE